MLKKYWWIVAALVLWMFMGKKKKTTKRRRTMRRFMSYSRPMMSRKPMVRYTARRRVSRMRRRR